MFKYAIALFVCLFSLNSARASHLDETGAALTYEYVGDNQFVFTLQITSFCPEAITSNFTSRSLVSGINLSLVSITPIDSACGINPCYVSGSSFGVTHLVVLKSDSITIAEPGATPHVFQYQLMDRYFSNTNLSQSYILIEAKMYKEGYPSSSPQVRFVNGDYVQAGVNVTIPLPHYTINNDSTYTELVSSRDANGVNKSYTVGYSASAPVQNMLNFDNSTGMIRSSGMAHTTRCFITQRTTSYSNQGLKSEITWDRGIRAMNSWSSPGTINTSFSYDPSQAMTANSDSTHITAMVSHGDTFELDLSSTTSNFSSVISFQTSTNTSGRNKPTITPQLGWSNPSTIYQVDYTFKWIPDTLASAGVNRTTIYLTDNSCPPAYQVITIDLQTDPAMYRSDTIQGCVGAEVPLPLVLDYTGNWVGASNVNCGSVTCLLTIQNEGVIEFQDTNGLTVHTVFIDTINPPNPVIASSSGDVGITNSSLFSSADWYFFETHIRNNSGLSISNAPWGFYQALGYSMNCAEWSNVIPHRLPQSIFNVVNSQGLVDQVDAITQGEIFSYRLAKDGPSTAWPQAVVLPGVTVGSSASMEMRVYKNGNLEYTAQDSAFGNHSTIFDLPHNGSGADLLWPFGTVLRFEFEVISGTISAPIGDSIVTNFIYDDLRLAGATGPSTRPDRILPIVVQSYFGVGLEESDLNHWRIYPNPANEYLNIEGASADQQWSIVDIHGRVLLTGNVEGGYIDISALRTGFYFLRIEDQVEAFEVISN